MNTPIVLSMGAYGMGAQSATVRLSRQGESIVDLAGVTMDENSLFNIVLSPLPEATYLVEVVKADGEIVTMRLIVE